MFTFCIQRDTIKVEPRDFGKDPVVAIKEEIQRRYANKVIPEVGLVISLLDLLDVSEGAVLYGDGCYYYKTEFRLIIFRPFLGEAFLGRVASQSEQGIKVTIGFFDDILIPPSLLPEDTIFDPQRRQYIYVPAPLDEITDKPLLDRTIPTLEQLRLAPEDDQLWIERKDWMLIRCEQEVWNDIGPSSGKASSLPPSSTSGAVGIGAVNTSTTTGSGTSTGGAQPGVSVKNEGNSAAGTSAEAGLAPFSLICSIAESGLGVLDWWEEDEQVAPEGVVATGQSG